MNDVARSRAEAWRDQRRMQEWLRRRRESIDLCANATTMTIKLHHTSQHSIAMLRYVSLAQPVNSRFAIFFRTSTSIGLPRWRAVNRLRRLSYCFCDVLCKPSAIPILSVVLHVLISILFKNNPFTQTRPLCQLGNPPRLRVD